MSLATPVFVFVDDSVLSASQDTVVLDEAMDDVAVVHSQNVLNVVASSQSFHAERLQLESTLSGQHITGQQAPLGLWHAAFSRYSFVLIT